MSEQPPEPIDSGDESEVKVPLRRAVAPEKSETTSDQRMYAMLAHLLGIVSGPFGALVIWLARKEDAWVEEEAREAINFQITVMIALVAGFILLIVFVGIFVIIGVSVLNVVFCVIAAAHVHGGESYRYPLSLKLIQGPPST